MWCALVKYNRNGIHHVYLEIQCPHDSKQIKYKSHVVTSYFFVLFDRSVYFAQGEGGGGGGKCQEGASVTTCSFDIHRKLKWGKLNPRGKKITPLPSTYFIYFSLFIFPPLF